MPYLSTPRVEKFFANILAGTITCNLSSWSATMICSSCRRTLFSRFRSLNLNTHTSSSSTTLRYASSAPATPNDNGPIPAPASISLTQPAPSQSSTSPSEPASSSLKKDGKTAAKPRSSMPGGKELKGLGYTKAKPRVIAMEDDEYPPWLWGLLDVKRPGAVGEKVDLTGMSIHPFPQPPMHRLNLSALLYSLPQKLTLSQP